MSSRSLDATSLATGPGSQIDGVLRTYAVFPESGLVACPSNLSFEEAATLPCAATTAWHALYGLEDRSLKPGDWVLTQGTGGVSLFGVQFDVAVGARVIATTSSKEKAEKLKELGATHVIN
jgi:NADPH:quinone reductase-like Zn-dependent oxidoreductase